ncbi:MAG: hypothetical protein RI556_11520 [Hydrogenovibrio sp.]|uniref:hypothetical protein n=1 Tax=Hydrogenovibrio sp. TaxID=2065821 RepID=UPI00286FEE30|nr:hypothetical protein [Hydrogenovibrio sp.]MDR9499796.1 hypothetical protein [Hydrogenovibrio sp.]
MFDNLNLSQRFNLTTGAPDEQGSLFSNEREISRDMSGLNVVHCGVDTLKQKISGHMDEMAVKWLMTELGENHRTVVDFLGSDYDFSKAPRVSGYRYMLKNNSLGVHFFFGSFHKKEWTQDAIAKIELSPQTIYEHGLENCYYICENLADALFSDWTFNGVEAHICADLQGWQPEHDFLENIRTTSRIKRAFDSQSFVAADLKDVAVRYDQAQSFLIGKSGRSQLAVYNKTAEAKKTGKIGWWDLVYQEHPLYDPEQDVYRVEVRLHDSVTKNLGDPNTEKRYEIKDIAILADHLQSLWKYGLFKLFRYHYSNSDIVRPEWQFLAESVNFNIFTKNEFFYKRVEAEVKDESIQFNIQQGLGHFASAFAKANIPDDQAITALKKLPVYKHICWYFEEKGMSEDWWHNEFIIKLQEKKRKFAHLQNNPFKNFTNYRDVGGPNVHQTVA